VRFLHDWLLAQPLRSARALFHELANARNAEAFDRTIDIRIMQPQDRARSRPPHGDSNRGGGYLFTPTGKAT
jgi:hypothetical protein